MVIPGHNLGNSQVSVNRTIGPTLVLCFSLIFNVFINSHEYAYKIICISDNGIKGLCLSFNLVPSLVAYDK